MKKIIFNIITCFLGSLLIIGCPLIDSDTATHGRLLQNEDINWDGSMFAGLTNPTMSGSIIIPGTVRIVCADALKGCTGLTHVTMQSGMLWIRHRAFKDCTGLQGVVIPNTVNFIEKNVFENCVSLKEITLPNKLKHLEDESFKGCTSLTQAVIPNTLEAFGSNMFENCTSLETITVPVSENVKMIPRGTFLNCSKLKNVTISTGIQKIEKDAFSGCASLKEILIPKTVVSINQKAFFNCPNLGAFNVHPDNSQYTSVDGVLFNKSKTVLEQFPEAKIGEYTVPETVTEISSSAFLACTNTTVILHKNIITIGGAAFGYNQSNGTVYNCACKGVIVPNDEIKQLVENSNFDGTIIVRPTT